ncbi:Predicted xylanase/chitin deacetylase [Paenibacillus uliginis N3/975]|uniref:Predicted xylanase/chitin deacetylase n=1 Tax=Paenibacillus uliginis N3/975 TaxID=1313296 RepID=A0A1X7HDB6_9BACL|nr:polysaccharide deacetylase family protein [Paenibacillus uliginis]SMF84349.1 Predicted xylanase/chitin deacetylase [Paenibacillus uliginis N3/975]
MANVLLTFPEGKHKVLTMSYDDGRTADKRLVSLFNEHRIKGTFHLNSGLAGRNDRIPLEEVGEVYRGHEISAHTVTHPTMARCAKEQIVGEIMEDRKALESITGYPVRGFSYPNGSFNLQIKDMLPYLGIEYARTVASHGDFRMPDDFMEWNPTCHHNQNLPELAETFKQLNQRLRLHMMYVWGHSYEFDQDNNWELIESFCESIGNRDDIWYATNMEIVDYMKKFQQLRFSASMDLVYNPFYDSIWLEVDGTTVEVKGGSQMKLV